jgi:hypothetical protein
MFEECVGGRDEGGYCWFSSPSCEGKLASGSKCFFTVFDDDEDAFPSVGQLQALCQEEGGEMAVIQTHKELEDVTRLINFGKISSLGRDFLTGSTYDADLTAKPNMYMQMWSARDNPKRIQYATFSYAMYEGAIYEGEMCELLSPRSLLRYFLEMNCDTLLSNYGAVCESRLNRDTRRQVVWSSVGSTNATAYGPFDYHAERQTVAGVSVPHISLTVCPKGHLTLTFLACDAHSDCGEGTFVDTCFLPRNSHDSDLHQENSLQTLKQTDSLQKLKQAGLDRAYKHVNSSRYKNRGGAVSVKMFVCERGLQSVHYSQVYDFQDDCQNRSDEAFCQHAACPQFTCDSGQCVSYTSVCDTLRDCLDKSDEASCEENLQPVMYVL